MKTFEDALHLEGNENMEDVVLTMPVDKTKTSFASELIVYALKEKKVPMQHKFIIKVLESVIDEKTGERMFTAGHINGAFNTLNKSLASFNITKYRNNGGVYYKFTTDPEELNADTNQIDEQLLNALNGTFEIANKLKGEALTNNVSIDKSMVELLEKISEIELFLLKNQVD